MKKYLCFSVQGPK